MLLPYFTLALLVAPLRGYVFTCLDDCECDTEDEIVHCHNGDRKELTLPAGQRLRGFPVIGLTYNDIQSLPNEATLLSKFPDLKLVDVERNPNFDCSTLDNYDKIKVISDCFKNISDISRVPRTFRPNKDCDMACQTSKHYDKLHEYVLTLWEICKEKYENFDMDTTLQQIQSFFKDVVAKINNLGRELHSSLKTNFLDHPKGIKGATAADEEPATPVPDLQEIHPDE